ncbi:XdhC family protein [Tepidanaerobacter syntrophicus]|uniref:XdhC family protein n=1 Tax=Tepidanaerobacter syntrophicus TaxID=224999 RepID=UPI001BD5DEDA|nr:XdhC/CoxI family protein [Tepidanaerobacter syntrophicus]
MESFKVIEKLVSMVAQNEPVALVTIVESSGSTPRGPGSMMLVDKKGVLLEGTIGGGILEERAKSDAAECLRANESKLFLYELSADNEKSLPMICGGNIRCFVKVFPQKKQLIIVGAGHVGEKLCKMASILGYTVIVVDDRENRATKDNFPEASHIFLGDILENLKEVPIDENTCIVIVTHAHEYDQAVLEAVIDSSALYIGMIGSTSKVRKCFDNLRKKGISDELISKVYSPIGLDIGGESPEEIALSIMAQIQAIAYKKTVPHLKLSEEAIMK